MPGTVIAAEPAAVTSKRPRSAARKLPKKRPRSCQCSVQQVAVEKTQAPVHCGRLRHSDAAGVRAAAPLGSSAFALVMSVLPGAASIRVSSRRSVSFHAFV